MMGCAKAGVNYVNCTPKELLPDPALVAKAAQIAARHGATVAVESDPATAVRGANALYTDVWVSMGEEAKTAERLRLLRPYQVNMDLCRATGNLGGELVFLHCLPAFHDDQTEVSKDTGAGGGRRLRGALFARLRRGREPHAHDQGAVRVVDRRPGGGVGRGRWTERPPST